MVTTSIATLVSCGRTVKRSRHLVVAEFDKAYSSIVKKKPKMISPETRKLIKEVQKARQQSSELRGDLKDVIGQSNALVAASRKLLKEMK